jgi:4-hydroxybenzoate polyprenyltransferase
MTTGDEIDSAKQDQSCRIGSVTVRALWVALRPVQWIKNLLLFAPLVFSQNLFKWKIVWTTCCAFFLFCMLSSAVYLLNDLLDVDRDRQHPVKKKRPVASGMLPRNVAIVAAVMLCAGALFGAFSLAFWFAVLCLSYLALQFLYSLALKDAVILDVFCIASSFFLRIIAGAEAIDVAISSWLLICTLFASLFLGLAKRRNELTLLGADSTKHRSVLGEYTVPLLDQAVSVATAGTVISYALYTLSPETVKKFNTENLWFTVPVVLYGIFRYLYLIYNKGEGGSPELLLIRDKPLLASVVLYVLVVGVVLYF